MIELSDGTTLFHFNKKEFNCKCGCGNGIEEMDELFLADLDYAREQAEVPFKIASAFRCEAHNIKVGGSPTSSHLSGHAVDIACTSDDARFSIIAGLIEADITRIGDGDGFIHADIDPKKNQRRFFNYYEKSK